ncbi:TPA: DUF4132 domain-containing protein [Clostridioides difficile]|uniref:DUF4132 domain-containing protein n=1 Tax=Clostridioides difficile TaxID=1496 RepID=UPI00038C7635|nr:DUF4132 domain-containing protein [Clostridioides difficile]EGT4232252.1 DUF4132 domain-containing protein [Clostridioides difficile]EQK10244.1 hypothetical protein QUI_0485 [Clostridioides difficile P59]MBG0193997.1 DUF4132 domain-containing protein [Clostridioides difficile]MBH7225781.1 DUF4132 domain-containing protein [Clostridioides difficile]MBY1576079.1 DUF4132 domain-containing protein [Clostridioides difficile]
MLERTRVEKNPKIIENFKNNFTKSSSKQYYDLAKSLWDCIENSSYYYREPEDKFLNMIKKYYNCHYYEIKNMDELLSGPLKNALELIFTSEQVEELCQLIKRKMDYTYSGGYYRKGYRSNKLVDYFRGIIRFISNYVDLIYYDFSVIDYLTLPNKVLYYDSIMSDKIALEIDKGNQKVTSALEEVIFGENQTALLTRQMIIGIMKSHSDKCYEMLSKLLLAAKQQEGLRQQIVESLDEGTISASIYMLKTILDNNLERFSSVIRALDTWTGLGFSDQKPGIIRKCLELSYKSLTDEKFRIESINSNDNLEIYFALWATATYNIYDSYSLIENLLSCQEKYKKLVALYFLSHTESTYFKHSIASKNIKGDDLEILAWVITNFYVEGSVGYYYSWQNRETNFDLSNTPIDKDFDARKEQFESLKHTLEILNSKTKSFSGSVFPWTWIEISSHEILKCMMTLTAYDMNAQFIDVLMENCHLMSSDLRASLIVNFVNEPKTDRQREFLLECLSDKSVSNRETVLSLLRKLELTDVELDKITNLLSLKTSSIRQTVIKILLEQDDSNLENIASSLIKSSNSQKCLGGLEIVNLLKDNSDRQELYNKLILLIEDIDKSKKNTSQVQILIDNLLGKAKNDYCKENGFGIYNPENKVQIPEQFDFKDDSNSSSKLNKIISNISLSTSEDSVSVATKKEAKKILDTDINKIIKVYEKFDELITENADYEYEVERWSGNVDKVLLGYSTYNLTPIKYKVSNDTLDNYPLAELWRETSKKLDLDYKLILDILFYSISTCGYNETEKSWFSSIYSNVLDSKKQNKIYTKLEKFKFNGLTRKLLRVLLNEFDHKEIFNYCLEIYYKLRNLLTIEQCKKQRVEFTKNYYRQNEYCPALNAPILNYWLDKAHSFIYDDISFTKFFYTTFSNYQLLEYKFPFYTSINVFARAHELGLMTEEQVNREMISGYNASNIIRTLTNPRWAGDTLEKYPWLKDNLKTVTNRIIEIESRRGDMPTEVSHLANNIQYFEGINYFVNILVALGKETFQRGYSYGSNYSKKDVLSSLLKNCYPTKEDDSKKLKSLLKNTDITELRLIESAMYAPQWVNIIEKYLNWKGLKSTIWYFHAHINEGFSAQKESEVSLFSPISPRSFIDGAFDVDWFLDSYKTIGEERFNILYKSAKYITSGGNSHRRAQLYADATLGKLDKDMLMKEIETNRNQDKLRSFSLLPMKKGDLKEATFRYEFIQKFAKESKQFGAQRRESESKACTIALENLARSAGFGDVNRMMWALETEKLNEVAHLFKPKDIDGTSIWIDVDENGKASTKVQKGNKSLKSIPKAIAKHPYVLELKSVQKDLKSQYSRAKQSLEQAMKNEIVFTVKEIANIYKNPVICPLIKNLVWVCDDNIGYVYNDKSKFFICNIEGETYKLTAKNKLKLAHPVHLFESGKWSEFQHDLFSKQLVQPFKQVFREYYRINSDEISEKTISRRYAGHQIQPKKTVALLRNQLWTVDYEEGLQKVFYKENIVAKMFALADWFSPADIEPPTIETVEFFDRKTYKSLELASIPPILFSEVMRDIDLVVSVAHAGGVDPETSHSTVEMRIAIAKELLLLLKINNINFEGSHALITGNLGEYSVHMGSGIVHKKGMGALNILPVHSQSRGKIFLPFADEDPKTAEIMSKILLLAEDNKIKDPSILSNL